MYSLIPVPWSLAAAAVGAATGLLLRLPFTRPLAVAGLAAVLWFLFSN